MSTNTQFFPAKRAIIIGMDGASMELVKNVINWGHAPKHGMLNGARGFASYARCFSNPNPARMDGTVHRFMAQYAQGDGF